MQVKHKVSVNARHATDLDDVLIYLVQGVTIIGLASEDGCKQASD